MRLSTIGALAALVLAIPPIAAAETINGTITFAGEAPIPAKIQATTDEAICGQQDLVDESLIVDAKSKGIRDVVVSVEKSKAPKPATGAPVLIDNKRCRFEPHVALLPANTEVTIKNSDRFLHTTLAKDKAGASLFNLALPTKDQEVKKTFKKPGVYKLTCEVHTWMKGYAFVTNETAALTDPSGKFTIEGVTPGKHKVKLWHEKLGEKTVEVDVPKGKPGEVSVVWDTK